jgi:hypothetical protein
MNPHTHILMRLQNIHRRAEHSLRREHIDAAVRDNLESIKREASLALAASEDLLGVQSPGRDAFHPRPTCAASPSPSRGEGRGEGFTATPQPEAMIH